ncbi:MAG: hypothetical protein MK200_07985, partial [Nitrosopumilus sp.]|nr:hypothetical protein [Nitrosopumilus sp.]
MIYPNIEVSALTFMDDIAGMGSKTTVEQIMENCKLMEKGKEMEFSIEKSKWMMMKNKKEEGGEFFFFQFCEDEGP